MKKKSVFLSLALLLTLGNGITNAQSYKNWTKEAPRFDDSFLVTDEARRIGTQVLIYQLESGGWPKNINMAIPIDSTQINKLTAQKNRYGTVPSTTVPQPLKSNSCPDSIMRLTPKSINKLPLKVYITSSMPNMTTEAGLSSTRAQKDITPRSHSTIMPWSEFSDF